MWITESVIVKCIAPMIAAERRQKLDKVNFVSLTIDASSRKKQDAEEWGYCPHCPLIRGETGSEMPFRRSTIGNFIVSRDTYCNYSRTQKLQSSFL